MTIIYCILIALGLYVIFVFAPALVMYKTVFCKKTGESYLDTDLKNTKLEPYELIIRDNFRFFEEMGCTRVNIRSKDGTELAGDYYSTGSDKLLIGMHGYNATPLNNFSAIGRFLMGCGYDVLMTHERAHGVSKGKASTLGITEQEDVIAWCKWACDKSEIKEVIIAGVSMGCVAVSYASDRLNDAKLKAMILDCGYTSPYRQIVTDSKKRHVPYRPVMPVLNMLTRKFLGIDIRKCVWDSLEKTTLPAFFMHGGIDETVPLSEAVSNYEHCASYKQLYVVDNAHHADSFLVGGVEAGNALKAFLESIK